MEFSRRSLLGAAAGGLALAAAGRHARAAKPTEIVVDWATYNPVSLVLKDNGWLEEALGKDGIKVRWVQSLGSNKALEFLNAGSIQFGSSAGAAALLAKINGNPIKSIYAYSQPEWTALVTRPETGITKVADLKGRAVAATKGTDPYIFLLRALEKSGLSEKDVKLVLLQHDQGKLALERGDVDAWAGLDPMMAQTEIEAGSKLFYRDAEANTWGVLNVPEDFARDQPEIVAAVLQVYERGRAWALQNPKELAAILAKAARVTDAVAQLQLERTRFDRPRIGPVQRDALVAAGKALQTAGVIKPDVNVEAVTDALIDPAFSAALAG